MVAESTAFDANLAAAAGDDIALLQELRKDFARSVAMNVDLLARARCDANWHTAAARLHALGASFHLTELSVLAEDARDGAPGDPRALRRLSSLANRLVADFV